MADDAGNLGWIARIQAIRSELDTVAEEARVEKSQQALFQLSVEYPVQTDWLLQDLPAAWNVLLSANVQATENALLHQEGTEAGENSRERLTRYLTACDARRQLRLQATLDRWAPFAFTEGATFRMSFMGYTEGLSDARHERFFVPGGRLTTLGFEDGSVYGQPRVLLDDARGMLRDVDVSFDQQRLLFAWKKSDRLDDYHLYEYELESGSVRQLTFGLGRADYEAVYLPDGDIVFASTRPEQSVPCWWTEISNLYRMNRDGQYVRRLAIDQVHTLYPQVMSNGRLCYTRWDYNDRGQTYPQPLFSMNPDGKGQRVFYGGNSWFPTSLLHTRGIPGSDKVLSIAAGHHTGQHGKPVIIDVSEGRDEGAGLHFIAPRRDTTYERVDQAMQFTDQFRYPYPFSEDQFLVSYQPDYGFRPSGDFPNSEHYGLYWMNADGERELLHRAPDLGVLRSVPLGHRPTPPVVPDTVDYSKKTASYYVRNVYEGIGLEGVARGEAKKIRVVRLNYRAAGVGYTNDSGEGGSSLNSAPISIANGAWDIKEILGDADIYADGSALFEVPAMESIYLQVLDAKGQAIQTTRSWDTLRPGEQKSCVGCHQKQVPTFEGHADETALAVKHGVQQLQPFYGAPRGFSFQREIQPMLDEKCVRCHDGNKADVMSLKGDPVDGNNLSKRLWTQSYVNLTAATREKNGNYRGNPEQGLVTWISKQTRPTELPPNFSGAAKSPLLRLLETGHYETELTTEEFHKLAAWMDLLVPFCGTYREANAWSEHEMLTYNYFEAKREQQALEEANNIGAYLASRQKREFAPVPQAAFTAAQYRSLFGGIPMQEAAENAWEFSLELDAALIDGVEIALRAKTDTAPSEVDLWLRQKDGDRVYGKLRLRPGGESVRISLGHPVRSDNVVFELKGDRSTVEIELLHAFGVLVRELPEHDGYQRHLDFVR